MLKQAVRSLRQRFTAPAASLETLDACLLAGDIDQARTQFQALLREESQSTRKLNALIGVFRKNNKPDLFLDMALAPKSSALSSLTAALCIGEIAREAGRFDEFETCVDDFIAGGGVARFRQFDFIGKLDTRDADLRRLLRRLKYSGVANPDRPDRLFANARKLASRVSLNPEMARHLYDHSLAKATSSADWMTSVKTAFAIQHLILEGKFSEEEQNEFVDEAAKKAVLEQLNPAKGALVLLCHAGFSTVRFSFLKGHIANIVYMAATDSKPRPRRSGAADRIPVNLDARAGLFAGLKALMQKKVVLLAPDGKQGSQKSSVAVLGRQTSIGEGAAFLAYESKCDTFWFAMTRGDDRFVPVMVRGPSRRKSESFPEFQKRFLRFYEKRLNDFFSGDPRNLVLTPRWASLFTGSASDDESEGNGKATD